MGTMAAMEANDWGTIIAAVIGFAGTIITSFHVKPTENIEKIIGNIEKLKKIHFSDSDQNKSKDEAIGNLLESIEHESAKLSPYPGRLGYLLAMWCIASYVSCYFSNDAAIFLFFVATVFLCALLWVFPRCKWGSEKSVAVWIFGAGLFAGLIGSAIGSVIGTKDAGAIVGWIGSVIGSVIDRAAGSDKSTTGSDKSTTDSAEGEDGERPPRTKRTPIATHRHLPHKN